METLLDNKTTSIFFINKNTDIIFICFNSLGMNSPETLDFYSLSKIFSVIFIMDKKSSWGNRLDWKSISEIVNNIIKDKESYSIGVSMGGTNSVLSAQYLNTRYVVAFNPQFSIHPRVVRDSEYAPYATRIKKWIHPTINDCLSIHGKKYYLFVSTNDVNDVRFLHKYPQYIFNFGDGYGHNLAFDLKNAGHLKGLLEVITSGPNKIFEYVESVLEVDKIKDSLYNRNTTM